MQNAPEGYYIYEECTPTKDALTRKCSECSPDAGKYMTKACTNNADAECGDCSRCKTDTFEEYEYSKCTLRSNTVCQGCNSSAGDMVLGSGKCNPCPAGTFRNAGDCVLCPQGKYNAFDNASACSACAAGFISLAGASRCVRNCSKGYYSPDGESFCQSTQGGFKTMISAWESPWRPTISAAAPVISYDTQQIDYNYFLVATQKPAAYSSELLLTRYNESWSVAGNGYDTTEDISDGKGSLASFALITSITMDTTSSSSTALLDEGGAANRCYYLVTERDETTNRGYLRIFSLLTAVDSWGNVQSFEGEAVRLRAYHPQVSTKHPWVHPSQSVFDASTGDFLVMDIGSGQGQLFKMKVDYNQTLSSRNTPFIASCIQLQSASTRFNPLSMALLPMDAGLSNQGLLIILNEGKIMSVKGHRAIDTSTVALQENILCGVNGGGGSLSLEVGSSMPCSQVDLGLSGATQVLLTATDSAAEEEGTNSLSDTQHNFVIYVLLTAWDSTSSAVAQIIVPRNTPGPLQQRLTVSVIWSIVHAHDAGGVNSATSIPLHFLPIFTLPLDGMLKSLYWVETKGIILRLGGGGHLSTACLCDAGLYCDGKGTKQCLDAPLGSYTDGPWTAAAIPCPPGTIRNSVPGTNIGSCMRCPSGYAPPSAKPSWSCESTCPIGEVFDEGAQECMLGCALAQGLYHDTVLGRCLPCWWGSQSTGGRGIESCIACLPGHYGKAPGICEVCPAGTSTWTHGATICTPDADTVRKLCADGVGSGSNAQVEMCPPEPLVALEVASLSNPLTKVVSIAGSNMDGTLLVVMRNSTADVNQNSFLFHLYDTIRAKASPLTLKASPPEILASPKNIFHHAQWCESCPSQAEDDVVVRFLFHAANLGRCIYRTTIGPRPTLEIFSGNCDEAGQSENGLLPVIHSMALMETDQLTPILYISTMTSRCAEVYALSLYDKTITHFVSQDILKYPSVQINVCFVTPLILASSKGTRGYLYAAVNDKIYSAQVAGEGAHPEIFLTNTPIIQIGNDEVERARITSMLVVQQQTTWDAHHILVATESGNIHSIPPSANTAYNASSSVVATVLLESMALIGRRLWYAGSDDGKVYQMLFADLAGCVGGFTMNGDGASLLLCMQAGRGLYTAFDGSLQSCPRGTYGIKAGAALSAVHCRPCPDGTIAPYPASAFCKQCLPGSFSNPSGTECVERCPAGTYRLGLSCVACQAGYSTSTGGSSSAAACQPCPAGSYSNEATEWQCRQCAAGYTSPNGAHNCIRICQSGTCAADGESCVSLTKDYKTLSQIFMGNNGQTIIGLTVDSRGGVFYTNGRSILYYFDDCPSYSTTCSKTGTDLLPPDTYTAYRFGAMALCDIPAPASSENCPSADSWPLAARKLYIASNAQNVIYLLHVCQDADGEIHVESMLSANVKLIKMVGGAPGFANGPFAQARIHYAADLELNAQCSLLYFSDFNNQRIRQMNLTSKEVTTVAGTGNACWKMGGTACNDLQQGCNPYEDGCASMLSPGGIGLSINEDILYLAAYDIDALVSINRMKGAGIQRMIKHCQFDHLKREEGTIPECNIDSPNSKSCMLLQPFDVVAVSDYEVYVGVRQGITKIYSENGGNTFQCQQIAGNYFDIITAGFKDGISPTATGADTNTNSLVNIPYKLAYAKNRGVLYFADYRNGAVRRILVKTACICPVGTSILPDASSCYNPSPTWAKKALPTCTTPGLYALEGDSSCSRNCSDAIQQGLAIAPCLISPKNTQFNTLSYTQLLGELLPPQSSLQADWYGVASSTQQTHLWNSIFNSAGTTSPIYYKQGKVPGRAPYGVNFASLTFSQSRQCWFEEEKQYSLMPVQMLPGLWYPCETGTADACNCPLNVNIFEAIALSQAERAAQALAPKRWQALRNAAASMKAQYLDENVEGCTAKGAVEGKENFPLCEIQSRSVFMILGSPDKPSPAACPASASDGGPCFPTFRHIQSQTTNTRPDTTNVETLHTVWTGANDTKLSCYLGWPAHYYCPNGYAWIAPSNPQQLKTCKPVATQVTCLSCLPGSFSYVEAKQKSLTGGPYKCQKCMQGAYSSAVGASVCLACPVGKYASSLGSTACTSCKAGEYTQVPMAYTSAQCVACMPGTGNCIVCTVGTYQNNAGQMACLIAPPGYYTSIPNATRPTPCEAGYFQKFEGRSACEQCPMQTFTQGQGATTCINCYDVRSSGNCSLTVDNICGKGCGLNKYWDEARGECATCPPNTLNALYDCAMDGGVCWQQPRKDYFINNNTITRCPLGTQAAADFQACAACSKGQYADTSTMGCRSCPAGKFSNTTQATACTPCVPGTKSFDSDSDAEQLLLGKTVCSQCSPGTFSANMESSRCSKCPAGQMARGYANSACSLCGYNTFNNASGMNECAETCDTSQSYFSIPGDTACRYCSGIINQSTLCQGCGLGMYFDAAAILCVACPAGLVNLNNTAAADISACIPCESPTAYASSSISCTEASAGYVPNSTKNGQRPCPAGSMRNASMPQCAACPAGTYAAEEGLFACSDCGIGYYAQSTGRSICSICDPGTVAPSPGTTACAVCPAGSRAVESTKCTPCDNNTYSTTERALKCINCGTNQFSYRGETTCQYCPRGKVMDTSKKECGLCAPGSFMISTSSSTACRNAAPDGSCCRQCMQGTYQAFASDATNCSVCDAAAGWVALSNGLTACHTCNAGQFAVSSMECGECSPGNYSEDGRRCVECQPGTYSSSSSAEKCSPCPRGTYQDSRGQTACLQCAPGTFTNSTGNTACTTCPPNTFNQLWGQSACRFKTMSCAFGQYLNYTEEDHLMDNKCIECVPCGRDEATIILDNAFYETNRLSYTNANTSKYFNQVCNGQTMAPLYHCIQNTPPPGLYLSIINYVGQSGNSRDIARSFIFEACDHANYNELLAQWVVGNKLDRCYVGCLYGINGTAKEEYMQKYLWQGGGAESIENPSNNIFLSRMLNDVERMCLPCPLADNCPMGKYRPANQNNPLCGPPCAIPPQCRPQEIQTGCISDCTQKPANAGFIGGSSELGKDACKWDCTLGFHLSDNTTECVPCPSVEGLSDAEAIEAIIAVCNTSHFILLPRGECLPRHTSAEICLPCQRIANGRGIGWDQEKKRCMYRCHSGYFLHTPSSSNQVECRLCTEVWDNKWFECPVGYFLDEESCRLRGEPPVCKPCVSKTMLNFTSNGGRNASECKGICPPGFHTTSLRTGQYFSSSKLSLLPFVPDAECVPCGNEGDFSRTCLRPLGSQCFGGFYRNLSVEDDQRGSCLPCRLSHECEGKGYYAPNCTGNEVMDAPCLPCSEEYLKASDGVTTTKQFIAYKDVRGRLKQVISHNLCPRVCNNNFVKNAEGEEECVSCKYLALKNSDDSIKTVDNTCVAQPGSQPSMCSFVFSHWNATPAKPWWDVSTTPWFPAALIGENRAGFCWPCPSGMITGEKDTDLCTLLPGFISGTSALPPLKEAIPAIPADVSLAIGAFPSPSKYFLNQGISRPGSPATGNRRLLTIRLAMMTGLTNTSKEVAAWEGRACPHGYYKPPKGEGTCSPCPAGSSTRETGNIDRGTCMCFYGYYKTVTSDREKIAYCLPCPTDTFRNVSVSVVSAIPIRREEYQKNWTDAQMQCTPCPPHQTTYDDVGATRCVCRLGMIMNANTGECEGCPEGHYCPPCEATDASCPSGGIKQVACFYGASSPAGSYGIQNCSCAANMVKKARPQNPEKFYCLKIPFGGEMNAISGKIVCKTGWRVVAVAEDGSAAECALCSPGWYATTLSPNQISLSADKKPVCKACPKGKYLASAYGMGADDCTDCPFSQITNGEGASSLQNCTCPSKMGKDPVRGTCIGCTPTQYVDLKNTSFCLDCPANAMAQTGATSIAQCLCAQGFYSLMVSDKELRCMPCPIGTYSAYTSQATACTPCPKGSTTFREGATKLFACGEDPSLCASGYAWRMGVGCFKSSSS